MTLTTLDPITALVVVDLQNAVVALPSAHPTADVVARSARLADAFRRHGLPVVLVQALGSAPGRTESPRRAAGGPVPQGAADLVAELTPQPGDHVITKRTLSAFHRTGLAELLEGLGVTEVVVVGIATTMGVESTARAAYEHGLNVALAVDAMTDMSADAHENSVSRVFPRIAETGTTDEVIALLDAVRAG
ncbi:isochorismatase family protein [Cellulomonas sp. Root137]|uniref:isochorismatase family protein n=1 Tax=Cellulomonas sp. Root137 TaxID=1736459 RepID=UPI0006F6054A|nr:isochorismatase family protein [Cellulomonas sp. Root137]KQY44417.1 hydrolase [Cellulomonas sp. Root137]